MVSTELINTLKNLDRSSQIYVMQILLQELAEKFKESEPQVVVNKSTQETQQKRSPSLVSSPKTPPQPKSFNRQGGFNAGSYDKTVSEQSLINDNDDLNDL